MEKTKFSYKVAEHFSIYSDQAWIIKNSCSSSALSAFDGVRIVGFAITQVCSYRPMLFWFAYLTETVQRTTGLSFSRSSSTRSLGSTALSCGRHHGGDVVGQSCSPRDERKALGIHPSNARHAMPTNNTFSKHQWIEPWVKLEPISPKRQPSGHCL